MAAEYAQVTDNIEKRFMALVKRLKAAYDVCSGSAGLNQKERDQIHFYLAVRSIVYKLTKGNAPDTAQMNARVREMITEALKADGVEEIFKMGEDKSGEADLFDPDYLAKIEKIKQPNTKVKLLQQLLAKAIEDFKRVNKTKGMDFSKMFKALVDSYNERKEDNVLVSNVLEDFSDEIIDLIHALKKEKSSTPMSNAWGIRCRSSTFVGTTCTAVPPPPGHHRQLILARPVRGVHEALWKPGRQPSVI